MTELQFKQRICDVGHRLWQRGLCAGSDGNISVRLGRNRLLVTPTGISKGFMAPDDLCMVDLQGQLIQANPNNRQPTTELLLHLAIYNKRCDVKAIVHAHPPHAVAFALTHTSLPQGVYAEPDFFLGHVPLAPYATPGTQALPDSVTPLIEANTNTILMANHGAVSFAKTLTEAWHLMEVLDAYCRVLLLSQPLGPTKPTGAA